MVSDRLDCAMLSGESSYDALRQQVVSVSGFSHG